MLYDLTQAVTNNTPVYPGDPHPQLGQTTTVGQDGYAISEVHMGTHVGTHMDAPAHMIENGKQLKDYPVDRFIVPAICIDVRQGFDTPIITTQLRSNIGVLLYTGASDYFAEERYWHDFPVVPESVIQALINAQVSLIGIDTGSYDTAEDFPVHKTLLGADILLLECLTNLAPLAGKQFELIALPLKLENDGAPARVIARIG